MQKGYTYNYFLILAFVAVFLLFLSSCKPEEKPGPVDTWGGDVAYDFKIPKRFPPPVTNPNNPLTVNGVALGRKLFYETKLSGDNTQSCASCHNQANSFSDAPNQFSKGIDGVNGDRNSMALINLAWARDFFWDGRKASLEQQALDPVRNPIEMHEDWKNAIAKLQADPSYPPMFKKAFGTETVDSLLAARAITQFIKTITAGESKFQKFLNHEAQLTQQEALGFSLFMAEDAGDCFHCHMISDALLTDNYTDNPVQRFHNNGLNPEPAAGTFTGRGAVTKNAADNGKFKTPTLININLTAPYMHDGRFNTLEEVINFYDSGVHMSSTLDANMHVKPGLSGQRVFVNGVRKLKLTAQQKAALVAFLKTLTDPNVATNPAYSKP